MRRTTPPRITRRSLLASGAAMTAVCAIQSLSVLRSQEQAEKTHGRLIRLLQFLEC